jgi:hypothetical protein
MAQGHDENERPLAISWPFTFAGLCLTIALSWFCLGFALGDRKPVAGAKVEGPIELAGHYKGFWLLLILGAISIAFGIIVNMTRDRQRS